MPQSQFAWPGEGGGGGGEQAGATGLILETANKMQFQEVSSGAVCVCHTYSSGKYRHTSHCTGEIATSGHTGAPTQNEGGRAQETAHPRTPSCIHYCQGKYDVGG